MIRLVSENDLSIDSQDRLQQLQNRVNNCPDFESRVSKAGQLWDNKSSSLHGRRTFTEIRNNLKSMSLSSDFCNYCEHDNAVDLEHIYPKSFFPEKTFVWENYLLACKICNSTYKSGVFWVLDDNDDLVNLSRGNEPLFNRGAFVNPREEDPSHFFMVNLKTFEIDLMPGLSKSDENKAQKTREILQLNERQVLRRTRLEAAKYFYHRVCLLSNILQSQSIEEIAGHLSPYDSCLDDNLTLLENKDRLINALKRDIQTHKHPSVWHAIKIVGSKTDPNWIALFAKVPDALNW